MSKTSFEELVYRITGNIVSDDIKLNTEVGTTYNFLENLPHQPITFEFAKSAKKISYEEAIEKIFELAGSNKALSSVVVEDIVDVLDLLTKTLPFSIDFDSIKNREIKVRLLARSENPIDSDIVYNVLFYLITGRTLYIRTFREFRRSILPVDVSSSDLQAFIERNQKSLSEYYRRNRSLLLFIKNNYFDDNAKVRSLINKISKTSRKVNKPTKNKSFADVPLDKKPTAELLKMLHASDIITVRNGLTYGVADRDKEPYPRKEILSILKTRDDIFTEEQLNLVNDGWRLALPSSAKKAAGIVPNGSSIEIKDGDSFGIRWSDTLDAPSHVDLDLSFTTSNHRYGWDSSKHGDVNYSGDMTHMEEVDSSTQSASELFTIKNPNTVGVLDVSSYAFGGSTTKVELIIGDIVLPIEKPTSSTVLGFVINGRFYVYIDNKLNAKISSVYNNTVTNEDSFRELFLTDTFVL